jgi:hypothetical protein
MTRARFVAAFFLFAVLLGARTSHADNSDAYCTKDATGAGYCYGSFTGFQKPGVGYVTFATRGIDASFSAAYRQSYFTCTVPSSSPWYTAIMAAGVSGYRLYFNVNFDGQGNCTYVDLQNASWL